MRPCWHFSRVVLSAGGALLLHQRLIEPFSELSKRFAAQATADGKQAVMQITRVCCQPFSSPCGDKVAIHAIEILFAQPFRQTSERIFHHRRRLCAMRRRGLR